MVHSRWIHFLLVFVVCKVLSIEEVCAQERLVYPGVVIRHHVEHGLESVTRSIRFPFLRTERLSNRSLFVTDMRDVRAVSFIHGRGTLCRRAAIRRMVQGVGGFVRCSTNDEVTATQEPNDPMYVYQYAPMVMAAAGAWDVTTGSDSLIAMVIDSGVDYTHPDLAANMWRNPGEIPANGIDDDTNGYIDDVFGINAILKTGNPMDDHSHGTHVAGILGAVGNNGIGVVGVNWKVKIAAAKFLGANGSGGVVEAVRAINYGVSLRQAGHNVIAMNNSWGGTQYSAALRDAIQAASDVGVLFMAAAGNSAMDNDSFSFYPANYQIPNVVSVASTDSSGVLSAFSNYGLRNVHIAAPGRNILSTIPNQQYRAYSGTSMATPQITGLALLVRSLCDRLDMLMVRDLVLSNGLKSPMLSGRIASGSVANMTGSVLSGQRTCQTMPPPGTPLPTPTATATPMPTATPTPAFGLVPDPSRVNAGSRITLRFSASNSRPQVITVRASFVTLDGLTIPCDSSGFVSMKKGAGTLSVVVPKEASAFGSLSMTASSATARADAQVFIANPQPSLVPYSKAYAACRVLMAQMR